MCDEHIHCPFAPIRYHTRMRDTPTGHADLDEIIALVFNLKETFSLHDNDVRDLVMNALLTELQKTAPVRFGKIEWEWHQRRQEALHEAHVGFQARRAAAQTKENQ
jgi:hypothetical protein